MPCQTCGKEQNPERFHSHPLHIPKFKAKDKEKIANKGHLKGLYNSKRIVTKPLPLMYKSKNNLDRVNNKKAAHNSKHDHSKHTQGKKNKSQSEESLLNLDIRERRRKPKPLKTRSADNSPTRAKNKGKEKSKEFSSDTEDSGMNMDPKKLPLSHYIKQSKSSVDKSLTNGEDFTIKFYEKPDKKSEDRPESPFHNHFRSGGGRSSPLSDIGNFVASSQPEPRKKVGSKSFIGGTNTNSLAIKNSRGRGARPGHQSHMVMRRPSTCNSGPVEEPSDDEELEEIEMPKPLADVPEDSTLSGN